MKSLIWKAVFAIGLAVGLAMAMLPNRHNNPHQFLPLDLRRWVHTHDDAANIAAFFLFASVGLRLPLSHAKAGMGSPSHRLGMVVALMTLVCGIEWVQHLIPGRVADLKDVCTGWSGILAAWLLAVLRDPRAENAACK